MGKKVKSTILIVIMVVLVVGYFFYLSNFREEKDKTIITAVQNVLLRDLDTDYPPTPRELLKYYSDITKCVYNEKYTEDQLNQMVDKLFEIYDEDLLALNPREQYITDLKSDVKEFLDSNYSIVSYTVSSSTDVNEYVQDGRNCASLYCTYSIKEGADYVSSKQIFILRKDTESGHWKILGFDVVTPES